MPTGTILPTTLANVERSTSTQEAQLLTFSVPASLLVAGNNVIAAEVHQFATNSSDLSFKLSATANP